MPKGGNQVRARWIIFYRGQLLCRDLGCTPGQGSAAPSAAPLGTTSLGSCCAPDWCGAWQINEIALCKGLSALGSLPAARRWANYSRKVIPVKAPCGNLFQIVMIIFSYLAQSTSRWGKINDFRLREFMQGYDEITLREQLFQQLFQHVYFGKFPSAWAHPNLAAFTGIVKETGSASPRVGS